MSHLLVRKANGDFIVLKKSAIINYTGQIVFRIGENDFVVVDEIIDEGNFEEMNGRYKELMWVK